MGSNLWITAKRILLISFSCCILLSVILYWSISSAWLNPVSYGRIVEDEAISSTFDAVSGMITAAGTITLDSHSLHDNFLSLIDGIIRYITQSDMSLSDITLEDESSQSLRSVILSVNLDTDPNFPDISKIHPYILTYFMPEAKNVYSLLQTVRTGYQTWQLLIPLLCAVFFVLLLFSKKSADNFRITFILSGLLLITTGLFICLFKNFLFISSLYKKLPEWAILIEPLISKMTAYLLQHCIYIGIPVICIGIVLGTRHIRLTFDKISGKIATALLITIFILFVIDHGELVTEITDNVSNLYEEQSVHVLNQNEETVHSLMIKLREVDTDKPVAEVSLFLYGLDISNHPVWMRVRSDANGNARFVVPQGNYYIHLDETSLLEEYIPFAPVELLIENPGSSWYTLCLSKAEEDSTNHEIQQSVPSPSDPLTP